MKTMNTGAKPSASGFVPERTSSGASKLSCRHREARERSL